MAKPICLCPSQRFHPDVQLTKPSTQSAVALLLPGREDTGNRAAPDNWPLQIKDRLAPKKCNKLNKNKSQKTEAKRLILFPPKQQNVHLDQLWFKGKLAPIQVQVDIANSVLYSGPFFFLSSLFIVLFVFWLS
jgi:hypothetical protein